MDESSWFVFMVAPDVKENFNNSFITWYHFVFSLISWKYELSQDEKINILILLVRLSKKQKLSQVNNYHFRFITLFKRYHFARRSIFLGVNSILVIV